MPQSDGNWLSQGQPCKVSPQTTPAVLHLSNIGGVSQSCSYSELASSTLASPHQLSKTRGSNTPSLDPLTIFPARCLLGQGFWFSCPIDGLRKIKLESLSQGQTDHLGTAKNFQQPSLSMKSLPAECPASLLREPGEVGHTWLRDASCAPPSVLLLSSEQQTVKWEEEVETRNFRQVCSELPPSNHPTRLWISEPNRQQMREPVMQRREGCAIAVSAAA